MTIHTASQRRNRSLAAEVFHAGDELELVGPDVRPQSLKVEGLWDQEGNALDEVRKPQMVFSMKLPCPVPPLSLLRRQAEGL